jgi:HNH endonuclease
MAVARAATGEPVERAPYADPDEWAAFTANVVVVPNNGCHLWIGDMLGNGYGKHVAPAPAARAPVLFGVDHPGEHRVWGAHRWAWMAWHGPIPGDLVVMHECDEPLCVPITAETAAAHTRLGTNGDNARARSSRGRGGNLRHGLRRGGGDARGAYRRSLAVRTALRAALRPGRPVVDLALIVAAASAPGRPDAGQLALTDDLFTLTNDPPITPARRIVWTPQPRAHAGH